MKAKLVLTTTLLAGSLLAADSTPKQDITKAAKQLAAKANYSWTTTVVVPEGSRFRPGPTEGKAEKDGFALIKMSIGDTPIQAAFKGEKSAIYDADNGWTALGDLDAAETRGRIARAILLGFKAPAAQAADLAAGAKELKRDGDVCSGELTEEAVKPLLTFGRRGGADAPTVADAKGSVKFWTKDGELAKYEYKSSGKVTFNGNERDMERTTTVEIKEAGSTKVDVPEEAKKKLEATAK